MASRSKRSHQTAAPPRALSPLQMAVLAIGSVAGFAYAFVDPMGLAIVVAAALTIAFLANAAEGFSAIALDALGFALCGAALAVHYFVWQNALFLSYALTIFLAIALVFFATHAIVRFRQNA